ncbi:hypothetical protein B296_00013511 [Ensete ventricosum]|uniref:Uncharacterized protein n=1 Tax=Ensete ventricosum TaxID=4639 RepID=A0A427AMH0_ENSVE|nr:hypothetical protein B296_00013511 [Ensete ventricosum]
MLTAVKRAKASSTHLGVLCVAAHRERERERERDGGCVGLGVADGGDVGGGGGAGQHHRALPPRHLQDQVSGRSPIPWPAQVQVRQFSHTSYKFLFYTYELVNRCKVMIQSADTEDESNKDTQSKTPKTMVGALSSIWGKEGFPGLFKGLQAQILKTVFSSALLLMIKEKISKYTWISMLALRRFLLISQKKIKSH